MIHLFILPGLCYIYYTYTLGAEKGKIWCTWNGNKRVNFRHSAHTKPGVTGTLLWIGTSRRDVIHRADCTSSDIPLIRQRRQPLEPETSMPGQGCSCAPCRGLVPLSWNMALSSLPGWDRTCGGGLAGICINDWSRWAARTVLIKVSVGLEMKKIHVCCRRLSGINMFQHMF